MANLEALKQAIKDSGLTLPKVAERAGIDYRTLYNHLQGRGKFNVEEVAGLQKALKITRKERDDIFFIILKSDFSSLRTDFFIIYIPRFFATIPVRYSSSIQS